MMVVGFAVGEGVFACAWVCLPQWEGFLRWGWCVAVGESVYLRVSACVYGDVWRCMWVSSGCGA